jgi:rubrerythrin
MAEYDAVNLYEQMANSTTTERLKDVLLDIISEERNHIGELEELLDIIDKEHGPDVEDGKKEVSHILKDINHE